MKVVTLVTLVDMKIGIRTEKLLRFHAIYVDPQGMKSSGHSWSGYQSGC